MKKLLLKRVRRFRAEAIQHPAANQAVIASGEEPALLRVHHREKGRVPFFRFADFVEISIVPPYFPYFRVEIGIVSPDF